MIVFNIVMEPVKLLTVIFCAIALAVCERPPQARELPRSGNSGSANVKAKTIIVPTANAREAPADLQFLDTETALLEQTIETSLLVSTRSRQPELRDRAAKIIQEARAKMEKIRAERAKAYGNAPPAVNGDLPEVRTLIEWLEKSNIEGLKADAFDREFADFIRLNADAVKATALPGSQSDQSLAELAAEMRLWSESLVNKDH